MESTHENFKPLHIAEIQLMYKTNVKPSLRAKISGSHDAYEILKSTWDESRIELVEQVKILLLNRANKVLGIYEVSSGGVAGTVADPKLIFTAALKGAASGLILCHNHPSGNLNPSQADLDLTTKLKAAGRLLEIEVLDHIILTSEKYFSFADEGLF